MRTLHKVINVAEIFNFNKIISSDYVLFQLYLMTIFTDYVMLLNKVLIKFCFSFIL